MKKVILVVLITFLLVAISGCFLFRTNRFENNDIIASINNGVIEITTKNSLSGIEISLNGIIDEESIESSEDYLRIVTRSDSKTKIALVDPAGDIESNLTILKIKGDYENCGELGIETISEILDNSSSPSSGEIFPEGISIVDTRIHSYCSGYITIHAKKIENLGGSRLSITYSPAAFTIDTEKGNDGIEVLNTFSSGLTIVQHEPGILTISTVFGGLSDKTIIDEDIYRIAVTTSGEGIWRIGLEGEMRDKDEKIMEVPLTAGLFESGRPELLGDFNGNNSVDLIDFMRFAKKYGYSIGETEFDDQYDIAPAEDHYSEVWAGIFDLRIPDGQVKLLDFIVFARNYGKPRPNRTPKLSLPDQTMEEGDALVIDLLEFTSDEDPGDTFTYEIISGVGSIDDTKYTYSATFTDSGTKQVVIEVKDNLGDSSECTLSIEVRDVNRVPILGISDQEVYEGDQLTLDLLSYTIDPDDLDTFTYSISSGVGSIVGNAYSFSATYTDAGTKTVYVTVTDNKGATCEDSFQIRIIDVNRNPKMSIPDQFINEGETLDINLCDYASDPDEDELVFALIEGVGQILDAIFTYTPDYNVLKLQREFNSTVSSVNFEVLIKANDDKGGEATSLFTIMVTDNNRPPSLEIPFQEIDEGETLVLDIADYTSDPDSQDTFTYELLSGPGEITGSTYTFTSTYTDAGTKTVAIVVTDNKGAYEESSFKIIVNNVNRAPLIEIPDHNVREGEVLSFNLDQYANDPDDEQLSFRLVSGVGEIVSSIYTHSPDYEVLFSPGNSEPYNLSENFQITIEASDAFGEKSTAQFTVRVENTNRCPEVPELISPDSGELLMNTASTQLVWMCEDLDGDLLEYDVYLSQKDSADLFELVSSQDATSFMLDGLKQGEMCFWKVVARDAFGDSSSSTVSSFSVDFLEYTSLKNLDQVTYDPVKTIIGNLENTIICMNNNGLYGFEKDMETAIWQIPTTSYPQLVSLKGGRIAFRTSDSGSSNSDIHIYDVSPDHLPELYAKKTLYQYSPSSMVLSDDLSSLYLLDNQSSGSYRIKKYAISPSSIEEDANTIINTDYIGNLAFVNGFLFVVKGDGRSDSPAKMIEMDPDTLETVRELMFESQTTELSSSNQYLVASGMGIWNGYPIRFLRVEQDGSISVIDELTYQELGQAYSFISVKISNDVLFLYVYDDFTDYQKTIYYKLLDSGVTKIGELPDTSDGIYFEDMIYLSSVIEGYRIYDPSSGTFLKSLPVDGYPYDLQLTEERLYVASGYGFDIYDVSQDNLQLISRKYLPGNVQRLCAYEDLLMVASDQKLILLDVSDETDPQILAEKDLGILGNYPSAERIQFINSSYLVVSIWNNGTHLFDISDRSCIEDLGEKFELFPNVKSVVQKSQLIAEDAIYNIANLPNIELETRFASDGSTREGFDLFDDKMFVYTSSRSLLVNSLASGSIIKSLSVDHDNYVRSISVVNGILFMPDNERLSVYNVRETPEISFIQHSGQFPAISWVLDNEYQVAVCGKNQVFLLLPEWE